MITKTRVFLAVLTGILMGLSFPGGVFPNMGWSWVVPFLFVPVFISIENLPMDAGLMQPRAGKWAKRITPWSRARVAFVLFWISGAVGIASSFQWILQPGLTYGGVDPALMYLALGVYAVFAGLWFPIVFSPFIWNAGRMVRRDLKPFSIVSMAAVVAFVELIFPQFFRWTFGSLMYNVPQVNQWSSYFGFGFSTFFVVVSSGVLARIFTNPVTSPGVTLGRILGFAALWAVILGVGELRIQTISPQLEAARKTRVGWIQPNFTFWESGGNAVRSKDSQVQSMSVVVDMTEKVWKESGDKKPDLMVWPESVAPQDFPSNPAHWQMVLDLVQRINTPLLVQDIAYDKQELRDKGWKETRFYSASYIIRPDGAVSKMFKKWVPIPFGEYFPLESAFPFLGELYRKHVNNTSLLARGDTPDVIAYTPDDSVAPLICFDSIEPSLPRQQTLAGATLFINQANFVWMGESFAGLQFLNVDRFRAVENGRSLFLAANNGPTGGFDPLGRPLGDFTPLLSRRTGVLDLPVWTEKTVYTRWGNTPLFLMGVLGLLHMLTVVWQKRRMM